MAESPSNPGRSPTCVHPVPVASRTADGVADAVLDVEGWQAGWPGNEGLLLAGGAFPRRLRPAPASGDPLSDRLAPTWFREELFDLDRATGEGSGERPIGRGSP